MSVEFRVQRIDCLSILGRGGQIWEAYVTPLGQSVERKFAPRRAYIAAMIIVKVRTGPRVDPRVPVLRPKSRGVFSSQISVRQLPI
jgi:hypothetical protein